MTAAFIVTLVVSDPSPATLATTADTILDDLIGSGHDVESVKAWQRPSLGPATVQAGVSWTQSNPLGQQPPPPVTGG